MPSIKNNIVVNTSPIIYLSSINKIELLRKLFYEIIIPEAVRREIMSGGKGNYGYEVIQNEKWIKTGCI